MGKATLVRTLKILDRVIKCLECFFVGGSVLLMAAVLGGNFLSRNLFNISWNAAEEIGLMLLIVLTFVGVSYCARLGRHVRMSILVDLAPHKIKKILLIVTYLVTAFLMFYLAWLGWAWVLKTYNTYRVSPVLRLPLYIVYCAVPFGFFLAGVQYVLIAVKNVVDHDTVWIGLDTKEHETGS